MNKDEMVLKEEPIANLNFENVTDADDFFYEGDNEFNDDFKIEFPQVENSISKMNLIKMMIMNLELDLIKYLIVYIMMLQELIILLVI